MHLKNRPLISVIGRLASLFGSLACLTMALALSAHAQGLPRKPVVKVSLVSEALAARPGDTITIAMHQDIYPGWHTYWSYAGDAGAPPSLDWHLPEGFEAGPLQFPPPERMPYLDLMNFGYSDEVLLPVTLAIPENALPGTQVTLEADARWLVCEEICIPEEGKVSLRLGIAEETRLDPQWKPAIDDVLSRLPGPPPFETKFRLEPDRLILELEAPELAAAFRAGNIVRADYFPTEEGLIENVAEQKFKPTKTGLALSIPRGWSEDAREELNGLFVFTQDLADNPVTTAFAFTATPTEDGAAVASAGGGAAVWLQAIIFAMLGGLILNVMPCVFPVLFLKALTIMKHAELEAAKLRAEGLWYAFGVMASFALLGAVLLALRAGGTAVGWGFQLQSPGIVGALAVLLVAVGLSLSGVFSIGGSVTGIGSGLAAREGGWGSFFTGVLASVVATPCTAPFMGAAMGFAVTQPAAVALSVFIFLGFGMSLPLLVFSFIPHLAQRLPKPGIWMERAKQAIAFPMYGAAAWLVWVFAQQSDAGGLLTFLLLMVLASFGLWLFGATRMSSSGWNWTGRIVALAAIVALFGFLLRVEPSARATQTGAAAAEGSLPYEVWSEVALKALRAEDRSVFVNFTAAWCISCLANERVVFHSDRIRQIFEEKGITYMKGDWTNRDPAITRALAAHGRAGVPLYLWYPVGAEEPQVLPQILTVDLVATTLSGTGS